MIIVVIDMISVSVHGKTVGQALVDSGIILQTDSVCILFS